MATSSLTYIYDARNYLCSAPPFSAFAHLFIFLKIIIGTIILVRYCARWHKNKGNAFKPGLKLFHVKIPHVLHHARGRDLVQGQKVHMGLSRPIPHIFNALHYTRENMGQNARFKVRQKFSALYFTRRNHARGRDLVQGHKMHMGLSRPIMRQKHFFASHSMRRDRQPNARIKVRRNNIYKRRLAHIRGVYRLLIAS